MTLAVALFSRAVAPFSRRVALFSRELKSLIEDQETARADVAPRLVSMLKHRATPGAPSPGKSILKKTRDPAGRPRGRPRLDCRFRECFAAAKAAGLLSEQRFKTF